MCLIVQTTEPECPYTIAPHDIPCFKIGYWLHTKEAFISEIYGQEYKIGKTYWMRKPIVPLRLYYNTSTFPKVTYGNILSYDIERAFHSYSATRLDGVSIPLFRCSHEYDNVSGAVLLCVIPKGAKFYVGLQGYADGYASEKIKPLKALPKHNEETPEEYYNRIKKEVKTFANAHNS